MKYDIQVIPHEDQRYNTPGDYYTDESGVKHIRVSKLGNEDSEMGVALHELIEFHLCSQAQISVEEIEAWDKTFVNHPDAEQYGEPGNHPDAPYHSQHMFALEMERKFMQHLGYDWDEHDKLVLGLVE